MGLFTHMFEAGAEIVHNGFRILVDPVDEPFPVFCHQFDRKILH